MNHRDIFTAESIQIIDSYIVKSATKSFLLIKPYKSIGSSEPTYVNRSDDWFETLPDLVLCNVSITSILYALPEICYTWCIFSHPVTLWWSTKNWFYCPLICAQPWPSMDYQYQRVRLHLFSSESVLAGYSVVSWRGKKVVKVWKEVKKSEKRGRRKRWVVSRVMRTHILGKLRAVKMSEQIEGEEKGENSVMYGNRI